MRILATRILDPFFTNCSLGIFSVRAKDSLAMSHNLPLKLLIVSSSLICKFLNLAVRSSNLDSQSASFPSKATQRMLIFRMSGGDSYNVTTKFAQVHAL